MDSRRSMCRARFVSGKDDEWTSVVASCLMLRARPDDPRAEHFARISGRLARATLQAAAFPAHEVRLHEDPDRDEPGVGKRACERLKRQHWDNQRGLDEARQNDDRPLDQQRRENRANHTADESR
jgi:hypothetical protein